MSAYIISDISAIRPERIGDYLAVARPSIERYGGRYLCSSTDIDLLEGGARPARVVIVEFADKVQARRWYDSPEYAPARAMAPQALDRRLLLVDGQVE